MKRGKRGKKIDSKKDTTNVVDDTNNGNELKEAGKTSKRKSNPRSRSASPVGKQTESVNKNRKCSKRAKLEEAKMLDAFLNGDNNNALPGTTSLLNNEIDTRGKSSKVDDIRIVETVTETDWWH